MPHSEDAITTTLRNEATDGWPTVGGFAVENLGEVTVNSASSPTWPSTTTATVFGFGNFDYSRADGFFPTTGTFTFPEASVIDVDIYISSVQASTNITITASRSSTNEWGGALSDVSVGRHTVRMTRQNSGSYSLPVNEGLAMFLSSNNAGLTYNICLLYTSPSPRDS